MSFNNLSSFYRSREWENLSKLIRIERVNSQVIYAVNYSSNSSKRITRTFFPSHDAGR